MRAQWIRAVAVAIVGLAGCQSPSVAPTPGRSNTYNFRDVAGAKTFNGTFHVDADTVTMESSSGACDYLPASRQGNTIQYLCGELTFAFDRRNPARQPNVTWPYTVTQNESQCAIPSSSASGKKSCAAVGHVQDEKQFVGRLVLRPERVEAVAVAHDAPPSANVVHYGTFAFQEKRGDDAFQGTFRVIGDTVTIEANSGPCVYDVHSVTSQAITYKCGDVTAKFDRKDLAGRATYEYSHTVTQYERECTQYSTDGQGRRTCVQYNSVPKEVTLTESGYMRPRRIEVSDRPNPRAP